MSADKAESPIAHSKSNCLVPTSPGGPRPPQLTSYRLIIPTTAGRVSLCRMLTS